MTIVCTRDAEGGFRATVPHVAVGLPYTVTATDAPDATLGTVHFLLDGAQKAIQLWQSAGEPSPFPAKPMRFTWAENKGGRVVDFGDGAYVTIRAVDAPDKDEDRAIICRRTPGGEETIAETVINGRYPPAYAAKDKDTVYLYDTFRSPCYRLETKGK